MRSIPIESRNEIKRLRLKGKSIPEISRETGVAKTTVLRYVRGIQIPEKYRTLLKEKQGGSKQRALGLRENVLVQATEKLGSLSERDRFLLLVGLYWGEGTKRDLEVINSDPALIQVILSSLLALGIDETRLSLVLRVHNDISIPDAKKFWSNVTGLSESRIGRIEVIEGKKKGKLQYGMCRVRVRSGIRERLLIQATISLIGKDAAKRIVSG